MMEFNRWLPPPYDAGKDSMVFIIPPETRIGIGKINRRKIKLKLKQVHEAKGLRTRSN